MTTYTVMAADWNDPFFWSSISETTGGHALDFSGLGASFTLGVDPAGGIISISDGVTSFTIGEAGVTGTDANLGGTTLLSFFTSISGTQGQDIVLGTASDDLLDGNAGSDLLSGEGGNDTIYGNGGADTLDGMAGDDLVYAGADNDSVIGGDGADRLFGESGNDTIDAGAGVDFVEGGAGSDLIFGGADDDQLEGGWQDDASDTIWGGTGNDLIMSYGGDDTLYGEDGWDWIDGGHGDDSMQGGVGDDRILGDLGSDTIQGGDGYDNLSGGEGADSIDGGGDADQIWGNAGDTIFGGETGDDSDTLFVSGVDFISFATAESGTITFNSGDTLQFSGIEVVTELTPDGVVDGTAGADEIGQFYMDADGEWIDNGDAIGEGDGDSVRAGGGNDTVWSNNGNDTVHGEAGNDLIYLGAGENIAFGGTGADTIEGGWENDTISGDDFTGTGPNLIVNGSFEDTTGMSPVSYGFADWDGITPSWTDENGVRIDYHDDNRGGLSPTDGLNWMDMEASTGQHNVISQAVAGVSDGQVYVLTFDAADIANQSDGTTNDAQLQVIWNGDIVGTIDASDGSWTSYEFHLIGGSGDGSNTLTFAGFGGADAIGVSLDNVQMHAAAEASVGDDSISAEAGDDDIMAGAGNDTVLAGTGDDLVVAGSGDDSVLGGDGNDTIHGDGIAAGGGGTPTQAIGQWLFDNGAEPTDDTAALDNDALLQNGATFNAGTGAIDLDGADDFIEIADQPAYDLSSATIAMGFTLDTLSSTTGLFSKDATGNALGDFSVYVEADGRIVIRWQDDTSHSFVQTASGTIQSGVDYDLNLVLDSETETIQIYVNGTLEGGGSVPGVTLEGNVNPWIVGGRGWGSTRGTGNSVDAEMDGSVSYFEIYGGAFTPTELAETGTFNDTIDGGTGDDLIFGEAGDDAIVGGRGSDTLDGGAGDDTIHGGDGNDSVIGGTGDDYLDGQRGSNTLDGGDGADTFMAASDHISTEITGGEGGTDNDRLLLENFGGVTGGADITFTGDEAGNGTFGTNTITFTEIEQIEASGFADTINASADGAGLFIDGRAGADSITGGTGSDTLLGGSDNDTLDGGAGVDSLQGGEGNDSISGGSGNDLLDGGAGNDTLDGGAGADTLIGGDGNDLFIGSAGADSIDGGASWWDIVDYSASGAAVTINLSDSLAESGGDAEGDTLTGIEQVIGSTFDDVFVASATGSNFTGLDGNDTFFGGASDDRFWGEAGDDVIYVSGGADLLEGQDDADTFLVFDGFGNANIVGGEGVTSGTDTDVIDLSALTGPVTVTFTGDEAGTIADLDDTITFSQIERIILSDQAETVNATGDPNGVDINAAGGDDTITGGSGNDTIIAGDGNDSVLGGSGNDTLFGQTGDDTLAGGEGADEVRGGVGDDLISDGAGDDTAFGGEGNDMFIVGAGSDSFEGLEDADMFVVTDGFGNDTIIGGDTFTTGVNADTIDLSALSNPVIVTFDGPGSGTITDFVTGDVITFAGIEQLILTNHDDLVDATLDDGHTYIQTLAGNDSVQGSTGDDIYDDEIFGPNGQGNDTFIGGDGNDEIWAGTDDDSISGGLGNDTLNGQSGDDIIDGGDGDDSLFGGLGNDSVTGGAGNDLIEEYDPAGTTVNDGDTVAGSNGPNGFVFEGAAGTSATITLDDGAGTANDGDGEADWIYVTSTGDGASLTVEGLDYGVDRIVVSEQWAGISSSLVAPGHHQVTLTYADGNSQTFDIHHDNGSSLNTAEVFFTYSGNDTLQGGVGNDTLDGGTGDDSLSLGDGDDVGDGGDGADTIQFGAGDAVTGGADGDTFTLNDVDLDALGGQTTAFTVTGGEATTTGSDSDTLDLSGSNIGFTVDMSSADPEAGSIAGGDLNGTFSEIETVVLSGGRDTIVLADGSGADTVSAFDMTDSGDGTTNDQLDVSGLTDAGGNPVNVHDVTVTDTNGDGTGDAILTFPNGESITLVGVLPSALATPAALESIGIPGTDYVVSGTTGNDTISTAYTGDPDGDVVDGNDAADGSNDDVIEAGAGDDTVDAGTGNDTVDGGIGNDSVFAGAGDDSVLSGDGDDAVFGQDGNDTIIGGSGADSLDGDDGGTLVLSIGGSDLNGIPPEFEVRVDGVLVYTGTVTWAQDGSIPFDPGALGAFQDVVIALPTGTPASVAVTFTNDYVPGDEAFPGEDRNIHLDAIRVGETLFEAETEATITNGGAPSGNNAILWGTGSTATFDTSTAVVGGADSITGDAGNDTLIGDGGNDTLDGGADDDWIFAGADDDSVAGGTGNDWLSGESGNDTIDGGDGADTIEGAEGDDAMTGGAGADRIEGWVGDDTLEGGADDDHLDGGDGADVLIGGTGNDTLLAGNDASADSLDGGDGNDQLSAGGGNDTLFGGAGADDLFAADGDDILDGGEGDDTLQGWQGNDQIDGGAGDDRILGGDGDDTFVYDVGDGLDTIFDFNAGNTGALDDGNAANNDFIDLSAFYDNIAELQDDYADDGILNQSNAGNTVWGQVVDYANNTSFDTDGTPDNEGIAFAGQTPDGTSFTQENTGVVCFTPGTLILTETGERPVEELRPGDRIVTRDNGVQPLQWLARRRLDSAQLEAQPKLRPVLIKPDLIGARDALLVSPQHGVLMRPNGKDEVLVRAIHLARMDGGKARIAQGVRRVTYIHLMFEAHQIVFANGAPSESFYPGPMALGALAEDARDELQTLFPALFSNPADMVFGERARDFARFRDLPPHLDGMRVA